MQVICNTSHAKAFAAQIAGYGGEVAVERRAYPKNQGWAHGPWC